MRTHVTSAFVLLSLGVCLACCNAVFGVDDLVFESGAGGSSAQIGGAGGAVGGQGGRGGSSDGGGGAGGQPLSWWNDAYAHRVRIDIDVSSLTAPVTDLPVAVRLGDAQIDLSVLTDSATDLAFVDAQQMPLAHEVAAWQAGVGGLVWVRLDTVDAQSDHLWLYYGNPDAQPHEESAFSDAFLVLHHFDEVSGALSLDPRGMYDATLVGGAALGAGLFGSALELAAVGDFARLSPGPALVPSVGDVRTLSIWLRTTEMAEQTIWVKEAGCRGWTLLMTATGQVRGDLRTSINFCPEHTSYTTESTDPAVNDGDWHHVAWVVDRVDDALTLYVDGLVRATAAIGDSEDASLGNPHLGRNPFGNNSGFIGSFDELRVSNVTRDGSWFSLTHLNGRGSLLTFGADETQP